MHTITLPAETLDVRDDFDVIVVGAGMAGCCAAIAAARQGAKTLLNEALPFVGGNGTTGLPMATMRAHTTRWPAATEVIVRGIPLEIMEGLRDRGGFTDDVATADFMDYDADLMQLVLTDKLMEAGVHLLCHAPLLAVERHESNLTHTTFLGQDEKFAYSGKCFVDTSGAAALATMAGLETPMGRARDGKTQPMSLVFAVANIDRKRFDAAGGPLRIKEEWDALREETELVNPRLGTAISNPIWPPNRPGQATFNVTRILVEKGTDPKLLTEAEVIGRRQVEEFVDKLLRPRVPGFEACYLDRISHRVGVRETRRIRGEYELTEQDLVACTKFEDAVACNSYPVDIHSPDGGTSRYETVSLPEGGYYTIPYRSLVAREVDNLLAAGRCLSATHEALSAVRVNSCAMATGEAAGTAAALCAAQGVDALALDTDLLRETLTKAGARVD